MFHNRKAMLAAVCGILLLLFGCLPAAAVYAESTGNDTTVMEEFDKSGSLTPQTDSNVPTAAGSTDSFAPSGWKILMQILFSLGVIIVLIYLLLRFLKHQQLGSMGRGPFKVIGVIPLGNGKSVQCVMIGDSLYVLGVGENIQLLRHIPAGDELDLIFQEAELQPLAAKGLSGWLSALRSGKKAEIQGELFENEAGSFDQALEKQLNALQELNSKSALWEGDQRQKGNRDE
ncbi:flagellar biosynthetic protein FliO [Brevibacillus massiliensis]|uniref:flagellar biosynthetic protein FliO n=1 Tax=Brevibacillus massiliensis TaxID=1118054 RepID=UPI0004745A75|nr:flagellar biosynthetic protein FliO [Brevibacillus massiliensis]